jgi:hypothetical protein
VSPTRRRRQPRDGAWCSDRLDFLARRPNGLNRRGSHHAPLADRAPAAWAAGRSAGRLRSTAFGCGSVSGRPFDQFERHSRCQEPASRDLFVMWSKGLLWRRSTIGPAGTGSRESTRGDALLRDQVILVVLGFVLTSAAGGLIAHYFQIRTDERGTAGSWSGRRLLPCSTRSAVPWIDAFTGCGCGTGH